MKRREIQICVRQMVRFSLEVPSSSGDGTYRVDGAFPKGEGRISCACKGYTYRGECRHLSIEEDECGWNEFDQPTQTLEQKRNRVCPRCGSDTFRTFFVVDDEGLPVDKSSDGR